MIGRKLTRYPLQAVHCFRSSSTVKIFAAGYVPSLCQRIIRDRGYCLVDSSNAAASSSSKDFCGLLVNSNRSYNSDFAQAMSSCEGVRAVSLVGRESNAIEWKTATLSRGISVSPTEDGDINERSSLAINQIGADYTKIKLNTLGIVGIGSAAIRAATWCKREGMRVIGTDPFKTHKDGVHFGIPLAALEEVLAEADHVLVDIVATRQTCSLLGPAHFAACKKGAFLTNCGDAEAINESALLAVLNACQLSGAALDLAKAQPAQREPMALRRHPQVQVAPLPGAISYDMQEAYYRDMESDMFGDQPLRQMVRATERLCDMLDDIGSDALVHLPDLDVVAAHPDNGAAIAVASEAGQGLGRKVEAGFKIAHLAVSIRHHESVESATAWSLAHTVKAALLKAWLQVLCYDEQTLEGALQTAYRMALPVHVSVERLPALSLKQECEVEITATLCRGAGEWLARQWRSK